MTYFVSLRYASASCALNLTCGRRMCRRLMVCCEGCGTWFHGDCVGYLDSSRGDFQCALCIKMAKENGTYRRNKSRRRKREEKKGVTPITPILNANLATVETTVASLQRLRLKLRSLFRVLCFGG